MSTNGVVLGSREMRLRLDQRSSNLLQAMAKRYGRSPTEMAETMLADVINANAREIAMAQVLRAVMSLWCR